MSGLSAPGWSLEPIPILTDNYAWALCNGESAIVVDPGDAPPVVEWLNDRSLRLTAILLTHHHPDHVGGVPGLMTYWPDARIFAPRDERIALAQHRLDGGDRVTLANGAIMFDVIAIPGHTSSHIAYHGHNLLFCGDTLFSVGCGRIFEGTPAQMLDSLDALASLPDDTLVCCGHEYTAANCAFAGDVDPDNVALEDFRERIAVQRKQNRPSVPSWLSDERLVNPFLRVDADAVRDSLIQRRSLSPTASRTDAFAALRTWKDGYRG